MRVGPYKATILFSIMIGPLTFLLPHNVLAWGEQGEGFVPYGSGDCGYQCGGCGAYCAGQQDAQYDIQNNQQYQPYGQCLPCHSQDYWQNFHQGYDHYWNQHQEQNQGSSVSINGDNNYVSINQNQQQNPLQQLAHTFCGLVNCNNQGQLGGYNNGPPPN